MAAALHAIVLGAAAGGGFPQWNCRCAGCQLAWAGDPRVTKRTQSSLAVSGDGRSWVLLNASPDLRAQILATPRLWPREGARDSPITDVVLTNGDVDHIAGLLSLRERQPFRLHAAPAILAMLDADPVFGVLAAAVVTRRPLALSEAAAFPGGLAVTPFAVPGKVPLFLEGETVEIGAETESTIGLEVEAHGRRLAYIPGCAAVNAGLLARVAGADALLFDGTAFTDDEMVALDLSTKTAARMGHLAMAGPSGSLAALREARVGRRIYTHINNTNPVLIEGSPERATVEAAGWEVAHDGMEILL